MNSYERESLFPLFDDDALIRTAEIFLKNCGLQPLLGISPCSTYNTALEALLVPLLIERFKKLKESTSGKV
jgi:hypothetical protein